MIADAHRAALLNAVPSFGGGWKAWCAQQAEYVARFPDRALSDAELGHEFLRRLAWHLGERVASGHDHEVGWLFAALEPILADADTKTWNALTVGFLESLIHAIEQRDGDAAPVGAHAAGPQASLAWRAAFEYIDPPAERPPAGREG